MNALRLAWNAVASRKKRINKVCDALLAMIPLLAIAELTPASDTLEVIPLWFKIWWPITVGVVKAFVTFMKFLSDD